MGCGEAGSRRRVGNGERESLNDAQTGRLAGKAHVRLQWTGGRLPEPARTRLPVWRRMSRLKPVVEALMNNLRCPFFFFDQVVPVGPRFLLGIKKVKIAGREPANETLRPRIYLSEPERLRGSGLSLRRFGGAPRRAHPRLRGHASKFAHRANMKQQWGFPHT